jgi:hypothetical protein
MDFLAHNQDKPIRLFSYHSLCRKPRLLHFLLRSNDRKSELALARGFVRVVMEALVFLFAQLPIWLKLSLSVAQSLKIFRIVGLAHIHLGDLDA